jgi:nitrate reductase NapE component
MGFAERLWRDSKSRQTESREQEKPIAVSEETAEAISGFLLNVVQIFQILSVSCCRDFGFRTRSRMRYASSARVHLIAICCVGESLLHLLSSCDALLRRNSYRRRQI